MIRAGIVGAAGYVGSNLVRLVSEHPMLDLEFVGSSTHAGKWVSDIYAFVQNPDLAFSQFDPLNPPNVDVLFMAMPHATSHVWMHQLTKSTGISVFDLSADFRLDSPESFEHHYAIPHENPDLLDQFAYGIPELFRSDIQTKPHCALAGCFATAMILGLYPLRDQVFVDTIVIDGKTGMSGAGKKVVPTSLYCEVNEAVLPYNTYHHRHVAEVTQVVGRSVLFSPHIVPMDAGILCSSYIRCQSPVTLDMIRTLYQQQYEDCPFVQLVADVPKTKRVVGTNRCEIGIQVHDDQWLVVFVALDNLIKGAAGQAIQSMNIKFGFDETMGLRQ